MDSGIAMFEFASAALTGSLLVAVYADTPAGVRVPAPRRLGRLPHTRLLGRPRPMTRASSSAPEYSSCWKPSFVL